MGGSNVPQWGHCHWIYFSGGVEIPDFYVILSESHLQRFYAANEAK